MVAQISQPEFGVRLRKLRTGRGLSQRDLASGAVNQSYVSLLESGARVPTLDVAAHLARTLGVPVTALTGDLCLGAAESAVESAAGPAAGPAATAPPDADLARQLLAASAIDQGDLERAERWITGMYESAVAAGNPGAVLSHGMALEQVRELRGDRAGRYEVLNALLPAADAVGVVEARVRVRVALAAAARDLGRLDEAFTHVEQAGRDIHASAFRGSSEHVKLLAVHISVLAESGGGTEIVRLVNTMLAMAEELGSPAISGRARWAAGAALAGVGERERAVELLGGARRMLADPRTPLRDWARFSRAAASTLLDLGADPVEIEPHMQAARAATAAGSDVDSGRLRALEVRYAIATGALEQAVEMASAVDVGTLNGPDGVRFRHALGGALAATGRTGEAARMLRDAARAAEGMADYRRAARLWRELNELGGT
ncbi:helix-turn-helix domain-containing protein [Actinoplanes teichomyceticus]|uniref:Transcriptional regulator with XRE-family HTH domain n=1 Tax=Actinoplanes teichomyceticus TaxID=1867 RepID=A0A561WAZ8_ACTTI|nr:helix-turn-helix transcriptional regulator [Actinoplanes teichomyceticus]TWG21038.1 transcriptional regulator with XRE-family HTH domain [Actinoplanes teichomyceticus]GIF14858.1 hypothetical protein Ate01nite_48900 [Actinoplanes teichomyceticus]